VLSRIGRIGPLIWYLSPGANLALREIGIVLFLACVGLKSGSRFLEVLLSGRGFYWMAAGAVLTLFAVLAGARYVESGFRRAWLAAAVLCGLAVGMVLSSVPVLLVIPAMELLRWHNRRLMSFTGDGPVTSNLKQTAPAARPPARGMLETMRTVGRCAVGYGSCADQCSPVARASAPGGAPASAAAPTAVVPVTPVPIVSNLRHEALPGHKKKVIRLARSL